MPNLNDPYDFIHQLKFEDIPEDVVHCAKRCLLDTIAVAAAGRKTECAEITANIASQFFSANDDGDLVGILFDNKKASPVGAALANASMIDSVDAHDTDFPTKGHVGAGLIPSVLAMAEKHPMTGKQFLTTMIVGYEIAQRAGTTLHKTVPEYHTSGAWVGIGCAAVVARTLGLTREQTRHAHGISEYNGARSQMMRCIEWPTMVKDGSGWGSMVGVSSGLMAKSGFTGAPAVTVEGKAEPVKQTWHNLGREWIMRIQHFKAFPCCFWAHSALASLRELLADNPQMKPDQVQSVKVYTYHYATQLHMTHPKNTDEAQYSLPFPVACLLVRRKFGGDEIIPPSIFDPEILKMAEKVELIELEEYERAHSGIVGIYSHVELHLKGADGGIESVLKGPRREPWGKIGGLPGALTDDEVKAKAKEYLSHQLTEEQCASLIDKVWNLEKSENAMDAMKLIFK